MAAEISSRLWLILMMARLIRTNATTNTISPMSAALYMRHRTAIPREMIQSRFLRSLRLNESIIARLNFVVEAPVTTVSFGGNVRVSRPLKSKLTHYPITGTGAVCPRGCWTLAHGVIFLYQFRSGMGR